MPPHACEGRVVGLPPAEEACGRGNGHINTGMVVFTGSWYWSCMAVRVCVVIHVDVCLAFTLAAFALGCTGPHHSACEPTSQGFELRLRPSNCRNSSDTGGLVRGLVGIGPQVVAVKGCHGGAPRRRPCCSLVGGHGRQPPPAKPPGQVQRGIRFHGGGVVTGVDAAMRRSGDVTPASRTAPAARTAGCEGAGAATAGWAALAVALNLALAASGAAAAGGEAAGAGRLGYIGCGRGFGLGSSRRRSRQRRHQCGHIATS
jgi:hypothetical protein